MNRRNKGLALAMVLIVTAVVAVIGTGILSISLYEKKVAINDVNQEKAYYIARSGADAAAVWLVNADDARIVPPLPTASVTYTEKTGTYVFNSNTHDIKLSRTYSDPQRILIESSAKVGQSFTRANLSVHEYKYLSGTNVFKYAIASMSTIVLHGSVTIDGSISAVGAINISGSSGSITGTQTSGADLDYSEAKWPDEIQPHPSGFDTNAGDVNFNNNGGQYTLPLNKRYGDVKVQRGTMIMDVRTTAGAVIMDTFTLKDKLYVVGTKPLDIYINSSADLGGHIELCNDSGIPFSEDQIKSGARPINVTFYVKKNGWIKLPGNPEFYGYIYAPGAEVNVNGCSSVLGAIIGKIATSNGGTTIKYIPPAPGGPGSTENNNWNKFYRGLWGKP